MDQNNLKFTSKGKQMAFPVGEAYSLVKLLLKTPLSSAKAQFGLGALPPEIRTTIIQELTLAALSQLVATCKAWKEFIQNDKQSSSVFQVVNQFRLRWLPCVQYSFNLPPSDVDVQIDRYKKFIRFKPKPERYWTIVRNSLRHMTNLSHHKKVQILPPKYIKTIYTLNFLHSNQLNQGGFLTSIQWKFPIIHVQMTGVGITEEEHRHLKIISYEINRLMRNQRLVAGRCCCLVRLKDGGFSPRNVEVSSKGTATLFEHY